jgi:hypothetical protein
VVSAGAAGPAGAQAERTGARGKNAAFFSSFCFFLRHGNLSFILQGMGYPQRYQPCCDFFIYIPFGRERLSERKKLSQICSGCLKSGSWPVPEANFCLRQGGLVMLG